LCEQVAILARSGLWLWQTRVPNDVRK